LLSSSTPPVLFSQLPLVRITVIAAIHIAPRELFWGCLQKPGFSRLMEMKKPGFGQVIFWIMHPGGTGNMILVAKPFNRSRTKYSPLVLIKRLLIIRRERISNQLLTSILSIGIPVIHKIAKRRPFPLTCANLLKRNVHRLQMASFHECPSPCSFQLNYSIVSDI